MSKWEDLLDESRALSQRSHELQIEAEDARCASRAYVGDGAFAQCNLDAEHEGEHELRARWNVKV